MLITIISTVIVLGLLIFVHELGHFLLAKKIGLKVLKFSLGFGPKLIGKKIGETEYQIAIFPLGGFVKLLGEDPQEELKEEDRRRSLWAQPVWKRAMIFCAGSFFNLFLALAIFSAINLFGIPYHPSKIGDVSSGLPASEAGLKKGDRIVSIDGKEITRWEEISEFIQDSKGKTIVFRVNREGNSLEFKIAPKRMAQKNIFGEEIQTFVIGISSTNEILTQKVGPLQALGNGFVGTWSVIKLTVLGIVKLIQRVVPAKEIGSPIMIAKMAGEEARKGILNLAFFTALISINLGVLNLLPIPVLDGGHLLFLGIEAILRKPMSLRKMEIAQQIGLFFLILLMLFAIRNDLIRYFFPGGFKF